MIKPNIPSTFLLAAVLITVCLIAGQPYFPKKRLLIHPDSEKLSWVYGPERAAGTSFGWNDQSKGDFWCIYSIGDSHSCGWSLNLGIDRTTGLDLSNFDGLNILIHYEGDAPRVRVYLRDFDPAYTDSNDYDLGSKVMSTTLRSSALGETIYVGINEFSVAEWWITEFDIDRKYSAPSFDNVIILGLDFNVFSKGNIRVEKIEAIGQWITKEAFYFFIIFFWMLLILLEVGLRFYFAHNQTKTYASRMKNENLTLAKERQEFELLAMTDPLTGVLNRTGVQRLLQEVFTRDIVERQICVMLFDIDYFKNINDQYGHDVGDAVLKQLAVVIRNNIRDNDVFARWGGEEFLLICSRIPEEQLVFFAKKLNKVIEEYPFAVANQTLNVTVSIGVATASSHEDFEVIFKRADEALYQAKRSGRNRIHVTNVAKG